MHASRRSRPCWRAKIVCSSPSAPPSLGRGSTRPKFQSLA
jgi:hypothetical protein